MSYLSDTFGVPLGKQFKQPDLQVTPESLMAPQQPFGALNAIGVSQPQPQVNVGPSSTPPLWQQPVDTSNQYDYAPNSAYQSPTIFPSPALTKLGIGAPKLEDQLSASNVSQNPNTPGAFPSPAQLLDMPTRDQGKESKRLANMAGVGGILGLLLGGGAGALQGASSAVQGGSQALDFAAQNDAQKVQVENQKRLQEAANERQSWIDQMTVDDQKVQRQIAKDQADLKRLAEQNDRDIAMGRDETTRYNNMAERKLKTLQMINGYFDTAGEPLRNSDGVPVALIALQGWNAEARTAGFPQLEINENEISASPTAKVGKDIAAVSTALARAENLIEDTSYKSDIRNTRIAIEAGKLKGQELDNRLKEISVKYAPQDKESLIAWRSAMRSLIGPRADLILSQVSKTTAEATIAKNKAEGVGPVVLDPIQRKQIESVASSMDTDGWNKTVAAINAKYKDRIGGYTFGPDTPMGKAQALAESQRDKELEQAKTDRIQKAEKLGFTNVKFTGGSFTYDLPPTKRKTEAPTESNYLASDVPKGWGSWRDDWTDKDRNSFKAIASGDAVPFIKKLNGTPPKQNLNFPLDITSYGYATDKNDPNSKKGVGLKDMRLQPGDVGLSADVWNSLPPNLVPGSRVKVVFQKPDGTFMQGNFRLADKTAKESNGVKLANRFDIYNPASDKPSPYDGGKVLYIQKADSEPAKDIVLKPVDKKPLAKPVGRKVESKAPSVSDDRKRLDEINRKLNAKPKNMFEGYGG